MSTLEKAILLLQKMPEQSIETVYDFMQSMQVQPTDSSNLPNTSAFGIAHKYANPALIEKEKGAFEHAMLQKHAIN